VGSTTANPLLFDNYADHPNIYNKATNSTAAGRYQILHKYWAIYKASLGLPDFGPDSQDAYTMQQLKECHALDLINAGDFDGAVAKCAHIWASLPGSPYGQHTNQIADLQLAYENAGGSVA
jgi:muramidase (phage lysozyme)